MSPNNNLFLQTDFNSIEFNSNDESNSPIIKKEKANISQNETTEKTENNNNINNVNLTSKNSNKDTCLNNNTNKNDRSPLRKRIANSSNTIDTSSKYSNLNCLNEKNNNKNLNNNKADIFESINNLYNSNLTKHANLDYSETNLNNNQKNITQPIKDDFLSLKEENNKLNEIKAEKNSPIKQMQTEENFKKNVIYSVNKTDNDKAVYTNNDNFKRNKNNVNNIENKSAENNFPLKTDSNSNISSRNNKVIFKEEDLKVNSIANNNSEISKNNINFNEIQTKNNSYGKIYSAKKGIDIANNDTNLEADYQKDFNYKTNYNNNNLESGQNYNEMKSSDSKLINYNNSINKPSNSNNITNNLENNNLNNNFISNNKKNTSFLPSESMLLKHINKQKHSFYNINEGSNEKLDNNNSQQKSGYQRHFQNKTKENLNCENDSSFEELKNLENIVFIRAKLESKKNQLKDLKKQYDEVCLINSEIYQQLNEMENYKIFADEKIKSLENNLEYNENKFMERETEMMNSIKNLEDSKNFLEEKYVKLCAGEKLREREMELLSQKIKDMEIILEENENEYFLNFFN